MADPKVLKTRNKAHTLGPTEIYTSLLIVKGSVHSEFTHSTVHTDHSPDVN